MAETKFKIGDVVILKSGGPKMTVAPNDEIGRNGVMCTFFDKNNNAHTVRFHEDQLEASIQ